MPQWLEKAASSSLGEIKSYRVLGDVKIQATKGMEHTFKGLTTHAPFYRRLEEWNLDWLITNRRRFESGICIQY